MRDRIIEVMAEALCFVGKTCDRRCPDVDHRPCPDALSSWGQDAKRALAHLQAEGMTVVPVALVERVIRVWEWNHDEYGDACREYDSAAVAIRDYLAASPYGKAGKEKDDE